MSLSGLRDTLGYRMPLGNLKVGRGMPKVDLTVGHKVGRGKARSGLRDAQNRP